MSTTEKKRITQPISCNLDCGAGCPLTAEVVDGALIKVRDNNFRGEYMRGCAKGYRTPEVISHPDRLTRPLIAAGPRGSGFFREASWEEALDLVSEKLKAASPNSVMRIGGSGSCRGAVHHTARLTLRFLALSGGFIDTTGNYSSQAVDYINPFIFGTGDIGIDPRSLLDAKFIILWGFNPADTRFGCETEGVLREVKKRGIPVAVIDPRKTDSVSLSGGEWIPIHPGADAALAASLIFEVIGQKGLDRDFLESYAVGWEKLHRFVTGESDGTAKTPAWAAARCGVAESKIREMAEQLASSDPAALLPGLSLQRQFGGEETNRLLAFLQLVSGNWGKWGGSLGAGQWNQLPKVSCAKIPVPVNPVADSVPVNEWADRILDTAKPPVAIVYNVGGNYAVQSADSAKVHKALERAACVITHDFFLTETARLSDIILPPAMFAERCDISTANNGLLLYSPKAVEPPEGVLTDYEIFSALAERLGFGQEFTGGKTPEQWIDEFLEESEIDDIPAFKKLGFYEGASRGRIPLEEYFRNPAASPLATASGKVELSSPALEKAGCREFPQIAEPVVNEAYPLSLITPHEKFRVHSQLMNLPSLSSMVDDRLLMHAEDAKERGIEENDSVLVSSRSGSVEVSVAVTDEIVTGTVVLKSGYRQLMRREGISAVIGTNSLTSTETPLPSRGTRTHTNAVAVQKRSSK